MVWTAKVNSKELIKGIVNVAVEYTDGQDVVIETYRTGKPFAEWIPNTVRDKIAQLTLASSYDLAIGPVVPSDPPSIDPDVTLFRIRCRLLETVKTMVDMDAIPVDNAKVVALVNWIKNNADEHFDTLE